MWMSNEGLCERVEYTHTKKDKLVEIASTDEVSLIKSGGRADNATMTEESWEAQKEYQSCAGRKKQQICDTLFIGHHSQFIYMTIGSLE